MESLTHYGVLGMKWGKRKAKDSVGRSNKSIMDSPEIQKAKQNLEATKEKYKRATSKYNMEVLVKGRAKPKTTKEVMDTQREVEYAKQDLRSSKILYKLSLKDKTDRQLKLEEKYQSKGMSKDEAAVAAYTNIKTQNMLLAIGSAAVVGGVVVGVKKYQNEYVDKIIKSGTKLQHMSGDGSMSVRDAFYSTDNIFDNTKYKGMFGQHLQIWGQDVNVKSVKVLTDIKQASPDRARKILSDMVNSDDELKQNLINYLDGNQLIYQRPKLNNYRIIQSLKSGNVTKEVYDAFNVALVDHSPTMQGMTDKFFGKLAENGYNAIRDVNDVKYSGFDALNPLITFGSKGKVEVVDVVKLAEAEVDKYINVVARADSTKEAAKIGMNIAGASYMVNLLTSKIESTSRQKLVDQYRLDNPGTTMSNTEIYRMLERKEK